MEKIIETLKCWYRRMEDRRQANIAAQLKEEADITTAKARRDVQVMECDGALYLSIKGCPLVSLSRYGNDWPVVLREARSMRAKYINDNGNGK